MGLVSMTSNLTWIGPSTSAPNKMPLATIQNKITSYQEESIREQYNKFHVHDAPNINRLSSGRATDQPFIVRGIQRRDGDPQFYGPGGRIAPQNMLVRGGLIAFAARLAEDALRMGKFMISPKGIIWNLKQAGLQSSNPNVESSLPIRPTKSYNPLALAKNIITAPEGIHSARHGSRVTTGRYEDVQKQLLQTDASTVTANRLARLKVELFGDGQPAALDQEEPTDLFGRIVQGISNFVEPLQNALTSFDGSEINELSGPGGPKSVYGIGYTSIRRTVTSGTVLKELGGPHQGTAFWGIHYSPGTPYESITTPGAPSTLKDKGSPGNSIEKTYQPKKDSNYPSEAFLPNRDSETGGNSLLNISERFSFEELYLETYGPKGGRFIGEEFEVDTITELESINRPKVDTETGQVNTDAGKTILSGTPDSSTLPFPIGTKYLISNTAAQNKSREEGVDDNPGGGRYVGSSHDGSEETHQRAKNSEDKNLLDHAHKYHTYQNRDAEYPEGYYNLLNSNGGPRTNPVGGSKHNIYQSIEEEAELVRSLVDGKKITEHVHSFLGEKTQGIQTREPSTGILASGMPYTFGYLMRVMSGGPRVGEDWDAQDRINLYQLIDPYLGDASNKNTPQIRKSAERVFEPGSPVGYKPNASKLISSKDEKGLNAVKVGEAIFNYFTPDLKFFTGNTRDQIDEGGPHNYKSLRQKYGELEAGDEFGNAFNYIYGLDDPSIVPVYNDKPFGSKYTPSDPKVGPSRDAGQVAISGQTSRQVVDVDADILAKLDPMQNPAARPDETGNIKQIGGKPKTSAGTPLVYNYMNYSEIRGAAKQGGVLNPGKIQEFRRAISNGIKNEIQSRNRDVLGYGGAGKIDSLNATPVGGMPGKGDLVPFYLSRLGGSQALYFRCGINSVNDTFSPSWSEEKEIGRADPKVLLTGFGRTISLDLTVAAGSDQELQPMWDKLNVLAGWTAPTYVGNGYKGTFMEITLGNMYENMPCYLTNFSIDFDVEVPWEITPGKQMPKYANVTLELTYVGSSIPQDGSKFFGLSKFRGTDVAGGAASTGQPGAFDAIDNLIEDAPNGVKEKLSAPYNMAKDLAGKYADGAKEGFDKVADFFLPGDQSGDNAASSQIAGVAGKAYDGVKDFFSGDGAGANVINSVTDRARTGGTAAIEGGRKLFNKVGSFLNPFD